ncbi:MAG TPA: hypothetical protein VG753_01500 [Candidatus Paceibacterota bacterium]|nr:hypothetical protein [Candidatus Paceibacterota bacterium]
MPAYANLSDTEQQSSVVLSSSLTYCSAIGVYKDGDIEATVLFGASSALGNADAKTLFGGNPNAVCQSFADVAQHTMFNPHSWAVAVKKYDAATDTEKLIVKVHFYEYIDASNRIWYAWKYESP